MEREALPISTQVQLLCLNRTSLYYEPRVPSAEEVQLKHRIDESYTAHPYYGSRKLTAPLVREGLEVNRKAVQRHMREWGLWLFFQAPISPNAYSRQLSIPTC